MSSGADAFVEEYEQHVAQREQKGESLRQRHSYFDARRKERRLNEQNAQRARDIWSATRGRTSSVGPRRNIAMRNWARQTEEVYFSLAEQVPLDSVAMMTPEVQATMMLKDPDLDPEGSMAAMTLTETIQANLMEEERLIDEEFEKEQTYSMWNRMTTGYRALTETVEYGLQAGLSGVTLGLYAGDDFDMDQLHAEWKGKRRTREEVEVELRLSEFGANRAALHDEQFASWRGREQNHMAPRLFNKGYSELNSSERKRVDQAMDIEEEKLRQYINENPGSDVDYVTQTMSSTQAWFTDGLADFGRVIEKAAAPAEAAFFGAAAPIWFYHQRESFDQDRAARIEDFEQSVNPVALEYNIGMATGAAAYEWIEQNDPERLDDLLDAADGNRAQAMGFYIQQLDDNEEIQKLNEELFENATNEQTLVLTELQESNYQLGDTVLDVLAAYGRNVPGRLSTVAMLYIGDRDYQDMFTSGEWGQLWHEIGEESSALGHTPSAALGIEGTFTGLVADMGLMIAFDPATYVFGARLQSAARGALGATRAGALRMAQSPVIKGLAKDAIRIAEGPGHGASALHHSLGWLDDLTYSELQMTLKYKPKVFEHNNWMFSKNGQGAGYVRTGMLDNLVTEAELSFVDDAVVEAARTEIKAAKGFDKPVVAHVSRADGTVQITEGLEYYVAATREGWEAIPVRWTASDDILEQRLVGTTMSPATPQKYLSQAPGAVDINLTSFLHQRAGLYTFGKEATDNVVLLTQGAVPAADAGKAAWDGYNAARAWAHEQAKLVASVGAPDSFVYSKSITPSSLQQLRDLQAAGETQKWFVTSASDKFSGAQYHATTNLGQQLDETWYVVFKHNDTPAMTVADKLELGRVEGTTAAEVTARESEVLISGEYAITSFDEAARTVHVDRVGDLVPDPGVNKAGIAPREGGRPLAEVVDDPGVMQRFADVELGKGDTLLDPNQIFTGLDLHGPVDAAQVDALITKAIVERGARPTNVGRTILRHTVSDRVRQAIKRGIPTEIRSLFTPMNTTPHINILGASGPKALIENATMLWGSNMAKADHYIERIIELQQRSGRLLRQNAAKGEVVAARNARLVQARNEIEVLQARKAAIDRQIAGGTPDAAFADDVLKGADEAAQRTRDLADELGVPTEEMRMEAALADEAAAAADDVPLRSVDELQDMIDDLELSIDEQRAISEPGTELDESLQYLDERHAELTEEMNQARARDTGERPDFDGPLMGDEEWMQLSAELDAIEVELSMQRGFATSEAMDIKTAQVAFEKSLKKNSMLEDLNKITRSMWEDFNRTNIAPHWDPAKLDSTGMVPWEELRKGYRKDLRPGVAETDFWVPETYADVMKAEGIDRAAVEGLFYADIDSPGILTLPLSPLDMLAASTMTGSAWHRWVKLSSVGMIREGGYALHKAWVIDKVLRPATAATVSADELLRLFHELGSKGVARYANDRALFTYGRVQTALHGENPLTRTAVLKGSRWSPRLRDRLQKLSEYSQNSRAFEQVYYDAYGLGWTDITPGAPEYFEAARGWTSGMVDQGGFRAYLKGEQAFKDWWITEDGMAARASTKMQGGRTVPVMKAEEVYKGLDAYFEKVVLKRAHKQGTATEVREAFSQAAAKTEELGRAVPVEEWVLDQLGPVRGYQRHVRKDGSIFKASDWFFDRFFMDPVNYRRGFLAEATAKMEKARLESLFASQGKRIVNDLELQAQLGYRGLEGVTTHGVRASLDELAFRNGVVTEGYIDNLVQRAVDAELEHVLYNAQMGSRAGRAVSKTVFPFAKPWADMAAYWGREVARRPVFRGAFNSENLSLMKSGLSAKGHFNPKTAALISRMAHTDFRVDRGWAGVGEGETAGLIPGTESTDLSPVMFLPTAGRQAFGTILPGLGYWPTAFFDIAAQELHDPIEDPEGWSNMVDAAGQYAPSLRYGNPRPELSLLQRLAGGGTFAQFVELSINLQSMAGGGGAHQMISTAFGQPDHMIDRTRMASALMADDTLWDELFLLESSEDLDLAIHALALEADQKAAKGDAIEQVSRFALPATSKYSGELDQLYDVWIEAGTNIASLNVGEFDAENATPEDRRRYSDKVRTAFFALDPFEKDLAVVSQRTLAVNLVPNWEWTETAVSKGMPDSNKAYRIDPTMSGFARHQVYVSAGYIRPLEPAIRIQRILGTYMAARSSVAKSIYKNTAEDVNLFLWESVVSDKTRQHLEDILAFNPEMTEQLGVTDAKQLWEKWGTLEAIFEERMAVAQDIPLVRGQSRRKADLTAWDKYREQIKVPENEQAWGTTWPGTDPSKLSSRFANDVTVGTLPDDVREAAKALGVTVQDGMSGQEIFDVAHKAYIDTFGPISLQVVPEYENFIGELGKDAQIAERVLSSVAFNPAYDGEFRGEVEDFILYEQLQYDRVRDIPGGIPTTHKLAVQQRYMELMEAGGDLPVQWKDLWELRYERRYGILDWKQPVPPGITENSYQPVLMDIVDGDTIVVRRNPSDHQPYRVRLLGIRAADYGTQDDLALEEEQRLREALDEGVAAGLKIRLVRQPEIYGNVDPFGRELAWLYIGDEVYFFPNTLDPRRDPGAEDN